MEIETKLVDFDRIYNMIDSLSNIEKDKAIQQGLKDAANIFIQAGKSNLKERMKSKKGDSGNLLKAFKSKLKRSNLGALAGFNELGHHGHLIDSGTEERYTKEGYYRGKVTGNNFWHDAVDSNQNEAMDKLYDGIEKAITKLMNK